MNWHSAAEFIDMGGYGLYVWGAYAMTALILVLEPWFVMRRQRQALADAMASSRAGASSC